MTKKSFLHLLSKEISGDISLDEKKILDESLKENQVFDQVHTEMHRFMKSKQTQPAINVEAKLHEVWDRIHSTETDVVQKRIIPLWARIAASVAILIGLGVLAYNYFPNPQNLYSETLQAGNENLYAVLDDGTQVWLHKNARIAYNKSFGTKNRKIRLTGEAFFDVAKNAAVPLSVSANGVEVNVKGTAFNVNATRDDVEVALIRGLVGVKDTRQKNAREVLLHPNQKMVLSNGKIVVNENNYQITQTNDTIVPETRWLNDELVFNKQKLADIGKLMELRYDVKIDIQNAKLHEQRFTGSIKSESLEQMLDALKQSFPLEYEIAGNYVVIR